jgi:flagellar biosynthesis/type III secretory pathway M-ring protein FliF/YscJ
VLGAGLWMGGFIAIMIVSATSKKSLATPQRIALFRGLGRSYLRVAAVAFAVVVIPGAILLAFRAWDGYSWAVIVLALALVVVTAFAVRQARQLTRMRKAAAQGRASGETAQAQTSDEAPNAPTPSASLTTKASAARVLRTAIGLLSLAIFIVVVTMP